MPTPDQKQRYGQFAQKVEATLGIIPGTKLWSPFPFAGVNLQDMPPAIDDKEFSYMENFFRLGNGFLRTAWDVGLPVYTAPGSTTILPYFFWYNIGETDYVAVFLADGTGVQVRQSDGVVTPMGSGFYVGGGNLPICSQSGTQYLLIANNNHANDYWIWDGSILFTAGGVSPFVTVTGGGQNYTSPPTITVYGGSGTGASFTATITDGAVTNIKVTNPGSGYVAGDTVQIAFSGGGSDNSAILTSILTVDKVTGVTVVNGGTGFTSVPPITFEGGGGIGATGVVVLTGTSVAAINITAGGTGFFNIPTLTISAPTAGVTATATATVANGQISSVTITTAGSGYDGIPEITITPNVADTLASGAGLQAVLAPTSIASVTITAPGDGYTSPPAIVIAPGGNHAAYATVDMMPFGVNGGALETFNSRVWLAALFQSGNAPTGGNFIVSAAGSLTDFATSDGGVAFINSDRFLRKHYVGIRQSNGYLYLFGDSSVSVVSNIQTAGVPPSTTFTYLNVDPQIGLSFRDTIQDFGRTIVFSNSTGVYGLYGGAASKISPKLDRLFAAAIFPPGNNKVSTTNALRPSSAVMTVFNVKHHFMLLTVLDPELGIPRNVMVGWNEKEWAVFSQTKDLTYIGTQEVESQLFAWGTDGRTIFPLFDQPSIVLSKRLSTKHYGTDSLIILKDFLNLWVQAQDFSGGGGIDMLVSMVASGIAIQPTGNVHINQDSVDNAIFNNAVYHQALFSPPVFTAPPPFFPVWGTGTGAFSLNGLLVRFSTQSPDFALINLMIAYQDATAYQ